MVQKMEVVYEDEQLLVCYKPAGLATQTSSIVQQDMVSQVKYYRTQKGEPPYVGVDPPSGSAGGRIAAVQQRRRAQQHS